MNRLGLLISTLTLYLIPTVYAAPGAQIVVSVRGGVKVSAARLQEIRDEAKEVSTYWLFTGHQPERWSVVVDGAWKGTSGFTSPELKDSGGNPTILLSEATALSEDTRPVVAHELTHLVHYRLRQGEESWLQEGLALLVEYRVTQALNPAFSDGLSYPETSLTAVLNPSDMSPGAQTNRLRQYGHLQQYFVYIYRLCGKDAFLRRALGIDPLPEAADKKGLELLDLVIHAGKKGGSQICESFETSFRAFQTARFTGSSQRPELYVVAGQRSSAIRSTRNEITLPPYSAGIYRPGLSRDGLLICAKEDSLVGSPSYCLKLRTK